MYPDRSDILSPLRSLLRRFPKIIEVWNNHLFSTKESALNTLYDVFLPWGKQCPHSDVCLKVPNDLIKVLHYGRQSCREESMDIILQQPRELWFKTSVLWAHQLTAKWHVNADVWESTPWTFQKDYPVHTFLYKHLLRWKDQWGVNSTTVMDVLKRRGLILPVKKHHCMMTWSWRDQRRMLSLLCVCVCPGWVWEVL